MKDRLAVLPETVPVPRTVPPVVSSNTWVAPALPESETVIPVRVAGEELLLVRVILRSETSWDPGSTVWLPGEPEALESWRTGSAWP